MSSRRRPNETSCDAGRTNFAAGQTWRSRTSSTLFGRVI